MPDQVLSQTEGEWECDECGDVRRGTDSSRPKSECPECGAAASYSTFFEYTDDNWDDDSDDDSDDE